jgi:hypothetical protein
MSNIHFIGGEKGGVGKSLTARVLAQYMIDQNLPFIGFDTDRSHGTLLRYYAEYASPIVLDRHDAFDAIIEAAAEDPERRILVDLAAQTHIPLVEWIEGADVLSLAKELGMKLTYWHVMDSGKDSVDLLEKLLDRFGHSLDLCIVRNQLRGNDFSILEASGLQARAEGMGAKVITIKKLADSIVQKIDACNSSFWAATHAQDDGGLGLMDRQRVKIWLRDTYREIADAGV